jgi:hypothetical protein
MVAVQRAWDTVGRAPADDGVVLITVEQVTRDAFIDGVHIHIHRSIDFDPEGQVATNPPSEKAIGDVELGVPPDHGSDV